MTSTEMARLMADEQRAAGAYQVARAAHRRARDAMGQELMPRALALRAAVSEGDDFNEDEFEDLRRLGERDRLERWELEGDQLRVTFGGSFRSEYYENDVLLPSWLLADDWKNRLEQERGIRRARLQALEDAQAREREVHERALLVELQAKYGRAG